MIHDGRGRDQVEVLESRDQLLVRMTRGESLFELLSAVVEKYGLGHAVVSGIGAIEDVELGAYDLSRRGYVHQELEGGWELLSLTGNVSWVEAKPFPHLHAVLSDRDCSVRGGHLFRARVYATLELSLSKGKERVERTYDPETCLKLWNLPPFER
jgi:predicted DNA-binding protein with PD1-like motif